MKAAETNIQRLTNGALQFIVPIYQRTYSWTFKQCNQLWRDIIAIAQDENDKQHFMGSVVYIDMGMPVGQPQQLMLIDGQQRLTTLSLLLCALARYIKENELENHVNSNKIRNYFLINNEETGEDRYKLLLTEQDKTTFIRLLDSTENTLIEPSIRIMENFTFFQKIIAEYKNVEKVFEGVNRLMLVSVSLDKNYDNPQLIFESMNSTGKDLSQADLIRNYILMNLSHEEQVRLYTQYWRTMEQQFGQQGYTDYFDLFMRDFLTTQNVSGRICKINEVYEAFKTHHQEGQTNEDLLKKIFTYSKYYTAIHLEKEADSELSELWNQIKILDVNVSYPFLMQIYYDYAQGVITKQDFIIIIKATISYIVRRVICEIPTNSLNKTFATFYKKIDRNCYIESVLAEYISKDSYRIFPTDVEVKEKLITKDIYHLKIKNYILEMLENQWHKEPISITGNGLTIEHIMPQNPKLSQEWINMLGENWEEVQRAYLHTIGNLTLTAYNSELSDRSFQQKKIMVGGFIDSHLRLNSEISQLDTWNETAIQKRTRRLAEQITHIWQYPVVNEKYWNKYTKKEQQESVYDGIVHYTIMFPDIEAVYEHLDRMLLALDSGIRKEYKKHYIAYKVDTNFADIEPFQNHLKLWLNMPFSELNDAKSIAKDVSSIGHHGNGAIEIRVDTASDLGYILELANQALAYQLEE